MNVDVDKIKNNFINNVNELYNNEVYFIEICNKFPNKYSLKAAILDDQLRIFFEENNKIVLGDKCFKYCTGKKEKTKLKDISLDIEDTIPNISVINYIVDDNWEKIDW